MGAVRSVCISTDLEGVAGVDDWDPRQRDYAAQAKGVAERCEMPRLQALLERLAVCYRKVPQETARFTGDAAVLQEVGRVSTERTAAIQRLLTMWTNSGQ